MFPEKALDTVADMRCPVAGGMAADYRHRYEEQGPGERSQGEQGPHLVIPDIEPILIHCAREISGRRDLCDGQKLITTPCQALADAGNALKLKDTRFLAWNGLLKELGDTVEGACAEYAVQEGTLRGNRGNRPGWWRCSAVIWDATMGME